MTTDPNTQVLPPESKNEVRHERGPAPTVYGPLRLFNTLTRELEVFEPLEEGRVGVYTCGPTVYGSAHVGNLRSRLLADFLRRSLELFGYEVRHVMNITDVGHLTSDASEGEDKMEVARKREGMDAWAVAKKYTDEYLRDCADLNVLEPHVLCKATDHIREQLAMVQTLEEKGYTYVTEDGVYFDTSKYPEYPELARLDVAGLKGGARVDLGGKKAVTDFALWKFSPKDAQRDMEWPSPWGTGFPGWHIECSAMARRYLGDRFDIHTAGVDLIPVHNTNERAQSECATGVKPFVRYWVHGEFLVMEDDEKMSKSKGNVYTLTGLKERGYPPAAFRFLCLSSHYRQQMKFSYEALEGAKKGLDRLKGLVLAAKAASKGEAPATDNKHLAQLRSALAHDMNLPQAVAALWAALKDDTLSPEERYRTALEYDRVLGLGMARWEASEDDEALPTEIMNLLAERERFRKERNFPEADRIRGEITALGYEILDRKEGATARRKR